MKAIAIDSSSAIYLAKVGLLQKLLAMRVELLTTAEISEEIRKSAEKGYKDARIIEDLIRSKKVMETRIKTKESVKRDSSLKDADASIVALAAERNCLLATEDSTLQNVAKSLGISVTNTAILLYYIYKEGQMAKLQCAMLLDLLEQHGYNKEITLKIREEMLKEGESDE